MSGPVSRVRGAPTYGSPRRSQVWVVALFVAATACSGGGRSSSAATTIGTRGAAETTTAPTSLLNTDETAPTIPRAAPIRTLPWISTVVEPNTRDTFAHTLAATGVHGAPLCTLGDLLVTATFGGAGGTEYAGIRVRNQSTHPCVVRGSPYVGILDSAGRSLGAYTPHQSTADPAVVLVPTSWAMVGLTSLGPDHCGGPTNDARAGSTAAAIAFGIDASETRGVRAGGDQTSANGCGAFLEAGSYTGPFAPISTGVGPGDWRVGPLRDGFALDVPRRVRRGTVLSYSITLTNTSQSTYPLVSDDGPLYWQSLGTTSNTLLLNCNGSEGLLIAWGSSMRFQMRLYVPADQPLGPATLRWQFIEPDLPAHFAQVTVGAAA